MALSNARSGTWALIPVKPFSEAKSRLGGVLGTEERRVLAERLLMRSLDVLQRISSIDRTLVVSRDSDALQIAAGAGAEPLHERGRGLNPALRYAIEHAMHHGAGTLLIIASDLPMVSPADVREMLEDRRERAVSIGRDRHGSGTNALLLRPPEAIEPAFGRRSFQAHTAAAREACIEPRVVFRPGLALDLDRPADLDELAAEGTATWADLPLLRPAKA
jgi:2-phospho-L-lactate guanylyltransferase